MYQKVSVKKTWECKNAEQIELSLVGKFSHRIWEPEIYLNIKK